MKQDQDINEVEVPAQEPPNEEAERQESEALLSSSNSEAAALGVRFPDLTLLERLGDYIWMMKLQQPGAPNWPFEREPELTATEVALARRLYEQMYDANREMMALFAPRRWYYTCCEI